MSAAVGQPAPAFQVQAYNRPQDGSDNQFSDVSLEDFTEASGDGCVNKGWKILPNALHFLIDGDLCGF